MIFCPICANLLVISIATGDQMWACQACTYRFPITKQVCQPPSRLPFLFLLLLLLPRCLLLNFNCSRFTYPFLVCYRSLNGHVQRARPWTTS